MPPRRSSFSTNVGLLKSMETDRTSRSLALAIDVTAHPEPYRKFRVDSGSFRMV